MDRDENVFIYREKARLLRAFAHQTQNQECRQELLRLAESFDRLADRVQEWCYGE